MTSPTARKALLAVLLTGVALIVSDRFRPEMRLPGEDSPDDARKFRQLQQQDENGVIPDDALMRALAHVDAMRASARALGRDDTSPLATLPWSWLGPGNIGGRVRAIVVHPTTTSTWFTGSVSGGIWKTTDSGTSWLPIDDFMANLSASTMVMQPGNPSVMYAGTGEYVQAIQGAGIFKSTDGGTTWARLSATNNSNYSYVQRLAMSPAGDVLLAATWTGIYRSTDGGATFTLALSGGNVPMYLAFDPTNGSKAVASSYSGNVWYSTNGGASWTAATGISVSGDRVELAYAPSNTAIVYAASEASGGSIYTSTNGGVSYSFVSSGTNYMSNQGWYDNTIWVDPTNSSTIVVGGVSLWKSTNAGVTLANVNGGIHADKHAIVNMPGYNGSTNKQVLVGSDGGVYFINDIIASPTGGVGKNNNLGITQYYGAAGNASSGTVVGGTQDNGTLRYTVAGGPQAITSMNGGDGAFAASDPTDPNYFYGEYQWLGLHRSSNAGISSSTIYQYIPGYTAGSSFTNFVAPFILDPNNATTLLAGGASLWRTTNAKAATPSFASIKSPANSSNISAIAVVPGNSNICWVGHNNGDLYKSTDCTNSTPTWTRMDIAPSTVLPNRMVMRVTVDPTAGNTVYVMFGGYSPDNIWRTVNGGTNWVNRAGTGATALPSLPIRDVEVHPSNPLRLYLATELGMFTSADAGASWDVSQSAPANVIVTELFWMGSKLTAATFGRGIYQTVTATPFTDDVLTAGVSAIRAIHITEPRTRIDALRASRNLAAYSWTDLTITAGVTGIRAAHISDLRSALAEVYQFDSRTVPSYTDAGLTAGTLVKLVHIAELRAAIIAIE